MSTLLCVPIMVSDIEQALRDAHEAKQQGADLIEFRIDGFFSGTNTPEETNACLLLSKRSPLPCVMTCRGAHEGGHYDGPDDMRIALYEALGTSSHPPAYIDLEFSTWQRSANLRQKVLLAVQHENQMRTDVTTRLILSFHDFEGRPDNLLRTVAQMQEVQAASVLKIAFTARSVRDNLEIFDLLRDRDRPTIALAMGEAGLMSRVLAPKFGGLLTFASLCDESATASGQPTIRELIDLYRFGSITKTTRVYGILGWPVSHSKSPQMHNAGFDSVGHDGVYLPLPVAPSWEAFKATLGCLVDDPSLDFAGASVTIPHKQHLLRFAEESDWDIAHNARLSHAANTLSMQENGWSVANTDVPGIIEPLRKRTGSLEKVPVLVMGAGGAARAAVAGLVEAGADVRVTNRSKERLGSLCESFEGQCLPVSWEDRHATEARVIINTTSVGMKGGPTQGDSPIDLSGCPNLSEDALIFDTVYTPSETPLFKQAQALGLPAIRGDEMLVTQAAEQFRLWTHKDAPGELFTAGRSDRDA